MWIAPPFFKWALIKALVSASQKFVDAPLLKASELGALGGKNRKLVLAAEELQSTAREVVTSVNPPPEVRSQLLGLLDIRVAHHVLQKPDAARGSFTSLAHIGWQLTRELADLTCTEVASPWPAPKSAAREGASPSKKEVAPKFSSTGKITNMSALLAAQNFKVGAKVQKKEQEKKEEWG